MKRRRRSPRRLLNHEKKARNNGCELIAGIDEAGRGPLAGPVVASAVIIRDFNFTCEINDSKALSRKRRILAYHEILNKATIGIGIISERTVDRINIRRATRLAMEEAVANLGVEPDMLLIDGSLKLNLQLPQKQIIRGDSKSLSIAAASIIAKVTRDALMMNYHRSYPEYGFNLHKGYGTKFHIAVIKKFGLTPIHRKTFTIKDKRRGTSPAV